MPQIILYWENGEVNKAVTVAKMQKKLYPDNVIAYQILSQF